MKTSEFFIIRQVPGIDCYSSLQYNFVFYRTWSTWAKWIWRSYVFQLSILLLFLFLVVLSIFFLISNIFDTNIFNMSSHIGHFRTQTSCVHHQYIRNHHQRNTPSYHFHQLLCNQDFSNGKSCSSTHRLSCTNTRRCLWGLKNKNKS